MEKYFNLILKIIQRTLPFLFSALNVVVDIYFPMELNILRIYLLYFLIVDTYTEKVMIAIER